MNKLDADPIFRITEGTQTCLVPFSAPRCDE